MIMLFKRFAVKMGFRNNCLEMRKVFKCENPVLRYFHHFRKLIICQERSSHFGGMNKRFCTNSTSILRQECQSNEVTDVEIRKQSNLDTTKIFEEIAAGNPEAFKKLKLLELEVAVLREQEVRVPDQISAKNWEELFKLETASSRKKFLAFLRLNELKDIQDRLRYENKRQSKIQALKEQGQEKYNLVGQSMFLRIYDKNINRLLHSRLMRSNLQVIFDCSYENYMSWINHKICAKQLSYSITEAKMHPFPCSVKLCNLKATNPLNDTLNSCCHVLDNPEESFVDIHQESYLDIFPKDKIVYLSPHAQNNLFEFDHSTIYVIGAFVDKGTGQKISIAKAKELGVRTLKLPIDEFLYWKKGTKSLPLNIVLQILLNMAYYNDWFKALKIVPPRCLINEC